MAFDALDDHEQGERLQEWLRSNGISIVVGIAIGLVLIFGYKQWRSHQATGRADAAAQFGAITSAYAAGKVSKAEGMVKVLIKKYPDSSYAVFAASARASSDVGNDKLDKARQSLEWAHEHADGEHGAVKSLMAMRLARVELAQGKAKQALSVLDTMPKGDYAALSGELRGDALVKLGRASDARKAYQAALDAFDKNAPQRHSVRMKLDNLATAKKQGA